MPGTQTISKPPARKRQQIAQRLREMTTTMSPGERLPSVLDLARQFGVATDTVKVALGVLSREGAVVSRPRSGTYVAERPRSGAVPDGDGRFGDRAAPVTTRTLAVFALCSNPFFQNCVEHLIREAAAAGLAVECRYADHNLTLEDALRFEALDPAGFVVVGMRLEWLAAALRERGHPVVLIGDPSAEAVPSVPTVYADAEYAGYLATKRLLDLGHRRIAYALRHARGAELQRKRRWRGHERALREAGVPDPHPVIEQHAVRSWLGEPDAARRYFAAPDAPTAVVAWYDADAVLVIDALRRAGLEVPGDVSVMGYDNLPIGAHYAPPLDTIDLHMDEQVRHALSLLSLHPPRKAVSTTLITPTLVCRASCAPPRAA